MSEREGPESPEEEGVAEGGADEEEAIEERDSAALSEVQESFDPGELRDCIESLEELARSMMSSDGVRDELWRLYEMASDLVNEDDRSVLEGDEPIHDLADSLDLQLYEYADKFQQLLGLLEKLTTLMPEDDS